MSNNESSSMDTDSYVLVETSGYPGQDEGPVSQDAPNYCKFFQQGQCRFGDECWNLHEVDPSYGEEEKSSVPRKSKQKSKIRSEDEVIICPNCHKDTKKQRTVMDVINRIQWDDSLNPEDFIVGYLDRFDGVVEEAFGSFDWSDVTTVDDFESFCIPKHRVKYLKQKGVIVWDRRTGVDTIFKRKTRGNECRLCGKQ